jgi:hypothetical protein
MLGRQTRDTGRGSVESFSGHAQPGEPPLHRDGVSVRSIVVGGVLGDDVLPEPDLHSGSLSV